MRCYLLPIFICISIRCFSQISAPILLSAKLSALKRSIILESQVKMGIIEDGTIIERSVNSLTNFIVIDTIGDNEFPEYEFFDYNNNSMSGLAINTTYYYRARNYKVLFPSSDYSDTVSCTTGFAFPYDESRDLNLYGSNTALDFDFDGDIDFIEYYNGISFHKNDGLGVFTENKFATGYNGEVGRFLDLNGDDLIDVITITLEEQIYLNANNESFSRNELPTNFEGDFFRNSFADLNNDKIMDFVSYQGDLYLSNGEYPSYDKSTLGSNGDGYPFFFDIENDGDLDLLIIPDPQNLFPNIELFINSNNTFTSTSAGELTSSFGVIHSGQPHQLYESIAFEDINNDGYIDILVRTEIDGSYFFTNNKMGGFDRVTINNDFNTGYWLLDIDNNGYLDWYGDRSTYRYYRNAFFYTPTKHDMFMNTNGLFDIGNKTPLYFKPRNQKHMEATIISTYLDIDNNGLFDTPELSPMDETAIPESQPWYDNNWIKFSIRGFAQSNTQAIGARIIIYTNDSLQSRQILNVSKSNSPDIRPHFGLGHLEEVDSVAIYWPSGLETKIVNPEINTVHEVNEASELEMLSFNLEREVLTEVGIPFSFSMTNSGFLDAQSISYNLYFSSDQEPSFDDLLLFNGEIGYLEYGDSIEIESLFTIPADLYDFENIILVLDKNYEIPELDVTNNKIVKTVTYNNVPIDILINDLNLIEGTKIDSTILSTEDIDADETYSYQLIDGEGSKDNDFFEIINDQLKVKIQIPSVIEQSEFNIRVKVNDGRGGVLEKTFVLNSFPDEVPPFFTNLNINSASVSISLSASLTASVDIDDNIEVNSVKIYVNGASGDFSEAGTVLTVSSDSYSYTFDAISIDDVAGIAVYFEATDIFGNTSHSDTLFTAFIHPEISVPIVQGGNVTNYQIMAFPITSEASVSTVLEDDLGAYEINSWRLFTYENGTDLEYKNGFTNIKSGQGYWLISKKSAEIDMPGLTAASSADITLRSGWNQIGNPFVAGLDWNEVINYNIQAGTISAGDIGNLIGYNSQFLETTNISAYEGAFVESANAVTIHIPRTSINPSGRVSKHYTYPIKNSNLNEDQWFVPLTIENQEYTYALSGFGMHPDATDQKDIFDLSTPPKLPLFSEIEYKNEWIDDVKMTRSVVSTKDQASWRFVVNTNLDDSQQGNCILINSKSLL